MIENEFDFLSNPLDAQWLIRMLAKKMSGDKIDATPSTKVGRK